MFEGELFFIYALKAAFTRSGVNGNSRIRRPVASATAFAIAAAAGP